MRIGTEPYNLRALSTLRLLIAAAARLFPLRSHTHLPFRSPCNPLIALPSLFLSLSLFSPAGSQTIT